jgi:hypothetical protein
MWEQMKRTLKVAACVAGIGLLLITLAFTYSTARGHTSWFIAVPRVTITLDGKPSAGYVHRARGGGNLFVTFDHAGKRQTYDLAVTEEGSVSVYRCGEWVAPRLPAIPIGDVNPPCFFVEPPITYRRIVQKASVGQSYAAFITDENEKLEAHW